MARSDRAVEIIAASGLFDREWYLAEYPDVKAVGMDPIEHYLRLGALLERSPSPTFDTRFYLRANPDVAKAGINPLVHYINHGQREGRLPVPPSIAPADRSERLEETKARPALDSIKRRKDNFDWKAEALFLERVERDYIQQSESFDAVAASVVMPTYNRASSIVKAIASVFRQTHRNWELLIVDDGSEDDTDTVIAHFLHDPRVKYFKNNHRGVSNARNRGLEQAGGEFVFYLDSDNWWRRHYLRTMITFMQTRGLSASFSAIEAVNDDGVTQYFRGDRFDWNACFAQNYIDLNSFGHRRAEVQNRFKFDESLRRLVDWDFILSVTARIKTAHAPFAGVWYYDGEDGRRITLHEDLGDQLDRTAQYIREKQRPKASLASTGRNHVG